MMYRHDYYRIEEYIPRSKIREDNVNQVGNDTYGGTPSAIVAMNNKFIKRNRKNASKKK